MTYSALENTVIASLVSQYGQAEARSVQRFLFECFTGLESAQYLLLRQTEAEKEFEIRILDAISQLAEFMPVQYVTGISWFCGFKFKVRPGVLIPRPETEEMVMKIARKYDSTNGLSVLDIGTGSGAIAISLEKLLPGVTVSAIDISKDALRITEENSFLNKTNLSLFEVDILNRNEWSSFGKFNLIVSNPPYVKLSERSLMRRNVLDYEPETALFVEDSNPLIYYWAIAGFAITHLEPGGELWFEINETEGNNISDLLTEMGFSGIQIYPDFNSKPRFVSAFQT